SRGGADPWYAQVAGTYIDLLDYFDADELSTWQKEPPREDGSGDKLKITARDRRTFKIARELAGSSSAEWLHPSLLYRLFKPRWESGAGPAVIRSHTLQRRLPEDERLPALLPRPYVALAASYDSCFPD